MQVVGPSGINVERFQSKMKKDPINRILKYHELATQMRVKGGNDYIDYVEKLLACDVQEKKTFVDYELKLMTDFKQFNDLMYQKENEVKLVRMAAGYAWDWREGRLYSAKGIET